MEKDYTIRLEKTKDYREVENLIRESFWNVYRPGCSEHYVIHILRDDPAFVKELDFVMEQDGKIIGQNTAPPMNCMKRAAIRLSTILALMTKK